MKKEDIKAERLTRRDIAEDAPAHVQNCFHAALGGNADAQMHLGVWYDFGDYGFSRNYEMARYWYRRAAEGGDRSAMTNLAYMYAHGNGVPVDGETAVAWYERAAALGCRKAMGNLAYLYLAGIFVEKDAAKAVRLYEEAVKDEADSECYLYDLATCYESGEGVSQDVGRALALYAKAAALGSVLAKKALARLNDGGRATGVAG